MSEPLGIEFDKACAELAGMCLEAKSDDEFYDLLHKWERDHNIPETDDPFAVARIIWESKEQPERREHESGHDPDHG